MEAEEYREKIIEIITKMVNLKYIKMIYNFANTLLKEEEQGVTPTLSK